MGTHMAGEVFRSFDSESANLLALSRLISRLTLREESTVPSPTNSSLEPYVTESGTILTSRTSLLLSCHKIRIALKMPPVAGVILALR